MAFGEMGAETFEAVVAADAPGAEFAEFGNGVAAEAVFDAEPVAGGEVAMVDEAAFAVAGGADGELIEEAGAAAVLA
mgnify:CR=1 FL=1